MSRRSKRRAANERTHKAQPLVMLSPADQQILIHQRGVEAMRGFYQNAVSWSTNLLNDQYSEYSLDDVTCARLYGINVTSWVCAKYRANTESGIPLHVIGSDEKPVPADENPIEWFCKNAVWLMWRITISRMIWGKFYLRKVRNRAGRPVRVEWLSPLDVSPSIDYHDDKFLGFRVRGRNNMVAPEDMIVNLDFDPLNDFDGVSPYEVAMRQITGGRSLVRFSQKYFDDGTMLGGMLTYEGDLEPEEYKLVKSEFEQFKGSQNAFKTFIAGGGLAKFDFKPMQPAPVDLAMPDLKDALDSDTCIAFEVNPILIGRGDAKDPLSANNTYDQVETKHVLNVAVPSVKFICQILTNQWLEADFGDYPGLKLVPDLTEVNAASKAVPERSTTAVANAGRIWSMDEARDYTGRPKLGPRIVQFNPDWPSMAWKDGALLLSEYRRAIGIVEDTLPSGMLDGQIWQLDPRASGKQSQLSFNVGGGEQTLPESQRMLPGQIPVQETVIESDNLLPVEILPQVPIRADPLLTKARLFELDNWRKKVQHKGADVAFEHKHLPDNLAQFVRAELAGYWNPRAVFEEARQAVRLGNDPKGIGATPEDALDYWKDFDGLKADLGRDFQDYLGRISDEVFDHIVQNAQVEISPVFDKYHGGLIDSWVGTLDAPGPLTSLLLAGMKAGDTALQKDISANPQKPRALALDMSWNLLSEQALTFARTYGFDLIRRIDDTTRSQIRDALAQSIAEGWSNDQLREAIAQTLIPPGGALTEAIRRRADVIGQTESTRAFVQGSFKRWQDSGVTEATWQTVRDDHVCPRCRAVHGMRARFNEGWTSPVDGETLTPPRHPGCRCFVRAVVA